MEIDKDLVAMTSRLQNESASTASLMLRLQENERKQQKELVDSEAKLTSQLDDLRHDMEMMRKQLQHMEYRETLVFTFALICLLLFPIVYLIQHGRLIH